MSTKHIDLSASMLPTESEKAVLGCMLNYPGECFDIITSRLKPSHFFVDDLRRIFVFLSSHYGSGQPMDVIAVTQGARKAALFKELGDQAERWEISLLSELLASSAIPSSIKAYIESVREGADLRRLHALGEWIQKKAMEGDLLPEIINRIEHEAEAVMSGWSGGGWSGSRPWEDYATLVTTPPTESTSALATGFSHLDHAVKMRGGHMILIGAQQKDGKSTLAKDFAIRWWDQGIPGAIISLEMKLPDIQTTIISSVSGIARDALEERRLDSGSINVMMVNMERVKRWPWTIYDSHRMNTTEFRALAKEEARKGARFLIVDYLQLMDCDGGPRERHLQLEEISRVIKQTALETGLVIVALSQLNTKSLEDGKRPTLAKLRGSGAFAQDADVVLLLWEEDAAVQPNGMRAMIASIEASRRGAKCDLRFLLDGARARFIES